MKKSSSMSSRSKSANSGCFTTIVQRFVCTGNLPTHPYPPAPPPSPYDDQTKTDIITKTISNRSPLTTNLRRRIHDHDNRSPLIISSPIQNPKNDKIFQHQEADVDEAETNNGTTTVPGIVARLMGLESLPQDWVHNQQHNAAALRSKSLNSVHQWPDIDQTKNELQQQKQTRFLHRRVKSSSVNSFQQGPVLSKLQTVKHSNVFDDPYAATAESNVSGYSNKPCNEVVRVNKTKMDIGDGVLLSNKEKKNKQKVEKNTSADIHKGGRNDKTRKMTFGDYCPKINNSGKSNEGALVHVSSRRETGADSNGIIDSASDATVSSSLKKKSPTKKTGNRRSDGNLLCNKEFPPPHFGSNANSSVRKRNQHKGSSKDGANQHSSNQISDHLECSTNFNSPSKGKKEPMTPISTNSRSRKRSERRIKLLSKEKSLASTTQRQHDNYHHDTDYYYHMGSIDEEERAGECTSSMITNRESRKAYSHIEDVNMEQVSMLATEYIRDVIWVEKKVAKVDDKVVQELSQEVLDILLRQFVDELCLV